MRRLLLTALSFLLAGPAWAQWPSTRATETLKRMFTQGGHFGFPPYAADPFSCTAQTKRTTYYNTTSNTTFVCNGTAWTALGASLPVDDGTAVVKGSVDATKLLRIEADGGTTGTTAVWSLLAGGGLKVEADSATPGVQVNVSAHDDDAFDAATGGAGLNYDLIRGGGSTVDEFLIRLDNSVNKHFISSKQSLSVGTVAATPLVLRTNSNERRYFEDAAKTLTDATATTFVQVAVPADSTTALIVSYQVHANNATDQQSLVGRAHIAIINDAGVETCSTVTEVGEVNVVSVGTLTATITCVTTPANAVDLQMNADTSLNVSPTLSWSIEKLGGSGAVTPQ